MSNFAVIQSGHEQHPVSYVRLFVRGSVPWLTILIGPVGPQYPCYSYYGEPFCYDSMYDSVLRPSTGYSWKFSNSLVLADLEPSDHRGPQGISQRAITPSLTAVKAIFFGGPGPYHQLF